MLQIVKTMGELNFSALMAVYSQSNRENGEEFYPQLSAGQQLLQAEQDFYAYLKDSFFQTPGAYYAVWTEAGRYVSALRLEPYRDGYLLEALETAPEQRRKGYAAKLLQAVLPLENRIYSHVGKKNAASLSVHEKAGFERIDEQAVYIDGSVNSRCCTMLWQSGRGKIHL